MTAASSIPLPPKEYMSLVSGVPVASDLLTEAFMTSSARQRERFETINRLTSTDHLLDVGCGCGRFARSLIDSPLGGYTGFDRHPGMVAWSSENITPADPRFRFVHIDVASPYDMIDGHEGKVRADRLSFPFDDNAFTCANLASVFTHMYAGEIRQYLRELKRVVRPGGQIVFSVFLTQKPTYDLVHNVTLNVDDFSRMLDEEGWQLLSESQRRLDRRELLWDSNQQNFFTATV